MARYFNPGNGNQKQRGTQKDFKQQQPAELELCVPEILIAVRSLYADQLLPYGRVLLKRLRERAAAKLAEEQGLPADAIDLEASPRVNPNSLRKLCASCRQLRLAREDGREYSVTLIGQPQRFLDICSPVDDYPSTLWEAFKGYLESLEASMSLPGGRYASAQILVTRDLPFLRGFSLAQVCHLVQLAITQRRLLGYREGWLVPFKLSDCHKKEMCASAQAPTGVESLPVVSTWDEVRSRMQHLFDSPHLLEAPNTITISNLKRIFRVHFELELSETALGHVRLLDLLKDPRLSDVCAVHMQRSGQLIVTGYPLGAWTAAAPMPVGLVQKPASVSSALPHSLPPCCLDSFAVAPDSSLWCASPQQGLPNQLRKIDASCFPSNVSAGSTTDETFVWSSEETASHSLGSEGLESHSLPSDSEDIEAESINYASSPNAGEVRFIVKNTFIDVEEPLDECFLSRQRLQTLPADLWSSLRA